MTTQTVSKQRVRWPSGEEIEVSAANGVRDAIIMHKKLGIPIVVWEDGKVVEIQPEDIVIPELRVYTPKVSDAEAS
jgi:hypothetical protein